MLRVLVGLYLAVLGGMVVVPWVAQAEELGATAAVSLSPIARLNQQKQQQLRSQVFLPSSFYYGKENTLTVRGLPNQTIKVLYRYLPVDTTDKTEGVKTITVTLNAEKPVATVALPSVIVVEETEDDTKTISNSLKRKKANANTPTTPPPANAIMADKDHRITGVQLQVITEAGTPVELLQASGQVTEQRVFPLVQPHQSSGAALLPSMGPLDGNVMRNIQSMAELSQDEEKRKRLQYDGTINRDRQIDRNSLVGPGSFGGIGGR